MTPEQTLFMWKLVASVGWIAAGTMLWMVLFTERVVRWHRRKVAELKETVGHLTQTLQNTVRENELQGQEIFRLRMQREDLDQK